MTKPTTYLLEASVLACQVKLTSLCSTRVCEQQYFKAPQWYGLVCGTLQCSVFAVSDIVPQMIFLGMSRASPVLCRALVCRQSYSLAPQHHTQNAEPAAGGG